MIRYNDIIVVIQNMKIVKIIRKINKNHII